MHEQRLVLVQLCLASAPKGGPGPLERLLVDTLRGPAEGERPPIKSDALRSVSIVELERRSREALKQASASESDLERATGEARRQGIDLPALHEVPRAARNLAKRLGPGSFRPGRQGYPISLYEWVASEYLRLVRSEGRGILPELAKRASERPGRDVSVSNARDWVHRARDLKLLSPGISGRAHAEPGPALRRELR